MITPEIPSGLIEKAGRALFTQDHPAWRDDAVADHNRWSWEGDGHSQDYKDHYRRTARDVLSAVYSDIRAQAFEEAAQAIEKEYPPYGWELQPDGRADTGREAYGEGLHTAAIAVRSLAGKGTP